MEIFIITLTFFLIVTLGTLSIIGIHSLLKRIKITTKKINILEKELYTSLREIQLESKKFSQTINKFTNSKNEIARNIIEKLIISILPFKRLKNILLIYSIGKKLL